MAEIDITGGITKIKCRKGVMLSVQSVFKQADDSLADISTFTVKGIFSDGLEDNPYSQHLLTITETIDSDGNYLVKSDVNASLITVISSNITEDLVVGKEYFLETQLLSGQEIIKSVLWQVVFTAGSL